jgi:PKD repeat protein
MIKVVLYVFLFLVQYSVLGQNTFHKVYTLGDTSVFFNNVIEKDSFYLVTGSIGRGGQRSDASIIKLFKNGHSKDTIIMYDPNYLNAFGNSFTEIDTNIYGDYLFHYTSLPLTGYSLYKPTITKFDLENKSYFIKNIDTLFNDGYTYLDIPRMLVNNSDSSYYLNSNYGHFDLSNPSNQIPDEIGFFIIKFSQLTDSILWIKRFTNSIINPTGPSKAKSNILAYENGNILVVSYLIYGFLNAPQEYAKVVFNELDNLGNIISSKVLQDSPYSLSLFGSSLLNNQKDLLICYSNSELLTNPSGWPYWGLTPAIARLDSNFQIIWKKDLGGLQLNPGQLGTKHMINKFAIVGDSAYVGAYFRVYKDEFDIPQGNVRMVNGSVSDTTINWVRDYNFFTDSSGLLNTLYEIRDIENTIDGGFIMVGEVLNYDSLQANTPGQLGYILKTNCLGFLDDPQASFSTTTTIDSLSVNFQNTSLMGGSFQWNFGDGNIFNTGENVDSISHIYSDSGAYQVQLIAYGCNGANDTITQTIVVSKSAPVEVANPNITNYMAVGPNPVKSGESIAVYVGNLPSTSAVLSFYDYQGKLLMERAIGQENSTYIMVLPFGAGVYQAVLRNGKDVLEVEKILVY